MNEINEKTYKVMGRVGGGTIALGVVMLVCGVVCGVLAIVNGAKLLRNKSNILF